jgi:hypothetical protein
VTRAVSLGSEKLELRTVWMEVVRAVRCTVRGGESRRRVPYAMRSEEQPSAWVENDLAIVGIPAGPDEVGAGFDRLRDIRRRDPEAIVIVLGDLSPYLAHLAFSLTGVVRG